MESSVPSKTGSPSSDVPVVETSPLSLDAASQNGSGDDALEESMSEASRSELWAAEELHALRAVLQVQDKQNKLTIKALRELTRSHETIIVSLRKEAAQAEAALVMVSNAHVKSIGEHAKREAVLISNIEEEKVRTSVQRDSHLRELEATLDLISCMRKEATSQAEDHQAELNRQQELLAQEREAARSTTSRVLLIVLFASAAIFIFVTVCLAPPEGLQRALSKMKDKGPFLGVWHGDL
jgi:hypothetical protein